MQKEKVIYLNSKLFKANTAEDLLTAFKTLEQMKTICENVVSTVDISLANLIDSEPNPEHYGILEDYITQTLEVNLVVPKGVAKAETELQRINEGYSFLEELLIQATGTLTATAIELFQLKLIARIVLGNIGGFFLRQLKELNDYSYFKYLLLNNKQEELEEYFPNWDVCARIELPKAVEDWILLGTNIGIICKQSKQLVRTYKTVTNFAEVFPELINDCIVKYGEESVNTLLRSNSDMLLPQDLKCWGASLITNAEIEARVEMRNSVIEASYVLDLLTEVYCLEETNANAKQLFTLEPYITTNWCYKVLINGKITQADLLELEEMKTSASENTNYFSK